MRHLSGTELRDLRIIEPVQADVRDVQGSDLIASQLSAGRDRQAFEPPTIRDRRDLSRRQLRHLSRQQALEVVVGQSANLLKAQHADLRRRQTAEPDDIHFQRLHLRGGECRAGFGRPTIEPPAIGNRRDLSGQQQRRQSRSQTLELRIDQHPRLIASQHRDLRVRQSLKTDGPDGEHANLRVRQRGSGGL